MKDPGINWFDHSKAPHDGMTAMSNSAGLVWLYVSWPDTPDARPLLWHWCVPNVETPVCAHFGGHWCPWGIGGHVLVSRSPLHLEPSLLWNTCCDLHGYIREGYWVGC